MVAEKAAQVWELKVTAELIEGLGGVTVKHLVIIVS